jgi:hypothetical protein
VFVVFVAVREPSPGTGRNGLGKGLSSGVKPGGDFFVQEEETRSGERKFLSRKEKVSYSDPGVFFSGLKEGKIVRAFSPD